ncbi:MAG: DUF4159 domain-containing protein [Planctomycetes bacterium]|nr:DUF4159 domain-containing protein [Planctomycetota bacterium]
MKSKALLLAISLAALSFFAAPESARTECTCADNPRSELDLDIVFVIDCTESMQDELAIIQDRVRRMILVLEHETRSLRTGVSVFWTRSEEQFRGVPWGVHPTANHEEVIDFISALYAHGGGEECIDTGLALAIREMEFRADAAKVIILVGDEAEHSTTDEALFDLVAEARAKDITLHTISARERTIDDVREFLREEDNRRLAEIDRRIVDLRMNLDIRTNPDGARTIRRLERERETMLHEAEGRIPEERRSEFVLPLFKELSDRGEGVAVAIFQEEEIVETLLKLSLGKQPDIEVDDPRLEFWRENVVVDLRSEEIGLEVGELALGQIAFEGDWNVPHVTKYLTRKLRDDYGVDYVDERVRVDLGETDLFEFPLLYLTGHGSFEFSDIQVGSLRNYLDSGGALFIDACCENAEFIESSRNLARALSGGDSPLIRAREDHPLLSKPFEIRTTRQRPSARRGAVSERETLLYISERASGGLIVLSERDVGCGLAHVEGFPTCCYLEPDAMKLGINIVLYALTR